MLPTGDPGPIWDCPSRQETANIYAGRFRLATFGVLLSPVEWGVLSPAIGPSLLPDIQPTSRNAWKCKAAPFGDARLLLIGWEATKDGLGVPGSSAVFRSRRASSVPLSLSDVDAYKNILRCRIAVRSPWRGVQCCSRPQILIQPVQRKTNNIVCSRSQTHSAFAQHSSCCGLNNSPFVPLLLPASCGRMRRVTATRKILTEGPGYP